MEELIDILHNSHCSCVVRNRGEIRQLYSRGIKDLHTIYTQERSLLNGAEIADKVVGRAAAAIMILGGVKRVYTDVISHLALDLLSKSSIEVSYKEAVPYIINRSQTDLCPMERATREIDSLEDIFTIIDDFVRSLA